MYVMLSNRPYNSINPIGLAGLQNNRNVKMRIINVNTSGHDKATIRYYASSRSALKRSPQTDEEQIADTKSNPVKGFYWTVFLAKINPADVSTVNVHIDIKIDYYCKLWDCLEETYPLNATEDLPDNEYDPTDDVPFPPVEEEE